MTTKHSMLTHIALREDVSNAKAQYYDVVFENEDTGVMSVDPKRTPPSVGDKINYHIKQVKSKTGADVNLIEWPVAPAFRTAPEVVAAKEVTAPVSNPVEEKPAEAQEKPYKAPDRDRLIVRQVAMKAAVDYHMHLTEKVQDPRFQIKAMADWIEDHILRSVD